MTGGADYTRKLKESIASRSNNGHGVFNDFTLNTLGGYRNANRMLSLRLIRSPLRISFPNAFEFAEVKHLPKTAFKRVLAMLFLNISPIDATGNLTGVLAVNRELNGNGRCNRIVGIVGDGKRPAGDETDATHKLVLARAL